MKTSNSGLCTTFLGPFQVCRRTGPIGRQFDIGSFTRCWEPRAFTRFAAQVWYGKPSFKVEAMLTNSSETGSQPGKFGFPSRLVCMAHKPEKSGFPSAVRGHAAPRSGFPSRVRGTPAVGQFTHRACIG